jgi:hypothetical protein
VSDLCFRVYGAAGAWTARPGAARWVMDLAWYRQVRAASEAATGRRDDPATWIPDPCDLLFGIPVSVRDGGGEPHLEMVGGEPDGQHGCALRDLALGVLAPPPLAEIPDGTMLSVAAVPGKVLEEWRHADFGVWIGWPHAVDAVHAEEMTAGQLRALLAERDGR